MLTDHELIAKAKTLAEEKVAWGSSVHWTNQDFIALSKMIRGNTGAAISHVTLKRLWGKVKYDGFPQTYTLNTLVQFIGYNSWRDFAVKNGNGMAIPGAWNEVETGKQNRLTKPLLTGVALVCLAILVIFVIASTKKKIDPKDYSFNSRTTTKAGIPNSVVFNYNADHAPSDSVTIQQSWDTRLRTRVARTDHQHTLIYYFPGYFMPKLVVDGQIVKEQGILIPSGGWITALMRLPVPIYFKKEEVINGGKMSLPVDKIKAQNIPLGPQAPELSYCYVKDFGEIYSDNFDFSTSVRNDYNEGSSVCQITNIYLLCEGTAINIPLCAKGCESALNFFFTNYAVSGKEKDLSGFGVDFNSYVKVRVQSANGKARIFLNDKLTYEVEREISRSKIIGIDYVFQGTGSVDYVKLSNKQISFDDEF